MKHTLITIAVALGLAATSQSDTIAVMDGGGPTAGDSAHTTVVDLSTGGDSIGSMTGSFSSDASGWRTGDTTYWNNTEWDFGPGVGSTATWTFANMATGSQWDVYSTWKPQSNRSQVAPYTIQGGTAILINQEPAPTADLVLDDGTAGQSSYNFQKIGTATVNGAGELVVTLGSAADDWVIIDAVAIVKIPPPSGLFWDGNSFDGDANGGSGTWDLTATNWDDAPTGGSDVAWTQVPSAEEDATFGGDFNGLVTLGVPITANSVTFSLAGYVLQGDTLTIDGASPAITASENATIDSDLAAPGGLTRGGAGTLALNGSGAGFSGTFSNQAGATTFASADWAGADFDLIGGSLSFASVGTTTVNSLELGANLDLASGNVLDVDTGILQFKDGAAAAVQDAGTLTASSGTLTVNGGTTATGTLATAAQAIRTIIADDGGPVALVKNNDNLLILDQANTYSSGTSINGGRVQFEGVGDLGGGDVSVADGGQLFLTRSLANNVTIAGLGTTEGAGTLGAIRFQNTTLTGNLAVDASGSRVVGWAGATGTIDGDLSGSGDLEINILGNATANGTISLLGSGVSHTGLVTVSGGRFNMGSALGGSVEVDDAGTLGDEGTIAGDLTLGFAGGATVVADADTPADKITVTNLTLNGVSMVILEGSVMGGVQYPFLSYTGTLTDDGAPDDITDNFALAGAPFRSPVFNDNAKTLEVSVVVETHAWVGATEFWEVGGPDANWTSSDTFFFSGDHVTFGDTGAGTVTINDLDEDIPMPGSVTFANTGLNDYTISGSTLAGEGGLTKNGDGLVILTGENSYSGGTVVNDGVLELSEAAGAGNGVGAINGEVTVNGPGVLRLSTANAFGWASVGTKVNSLSIIGGSVHTAITGDNGWGITINMTGGELGDDGTGTGYYSMGGYPADTGSQVNTLASADTAVISAGLRIRENNIDDKLPFNVADGTAVTDLLVSGNITNQGGTTRGITKSGDGVMLLSGANSYPGPTDVLAGCLLLNDIFAIPDLTMVTVADGAGFGGIVGASNLLDADIEAIVADVTWDAGGNARLVLDTNGSNVTVAADIVGNFKILKKGAGDLTLTGTVTVNDIIEDEGTVILNPTPDEITIDSITTGPGTNSGKMVTIEFTASGDVDVYASDDLQTWGTPIAGDVSASPFVEDDVPDAKRFYVLVPANDPAP